MQACILVTTLLEIRMSSGNLHLDAPTIMLQLYNVLDLDYRFVSRLLLVLVGQLQKVQMAVGIINIYRPPSFYCTATASHKMTFMLVTGLGLDLTVIVITVIVFVHSHRITS